jgi:hypothetical protein
LAEPCLFLVAVDETGWEGGELLFCDLPILLPCETKTISMLVNFSIDWIVIGWLPFKDNHRGYNLPRCRDCCGDSHTLAVPGGRPHVHSPHTNVLDGRARVHSMVNWCLIHVYDVIRVAITIVKTGMDVLEEFPDVGTIQKTISTRLALLATRLQITRQPVLFDCLNRVSYGKG